MDAADQRPQEEIAVKPIQEIVTNTCAKPAIAAALGRKPALARPLKEQALNCPRCNSTNTKFCYYNNYSLTQPRYFCKTCRRYWTEGGSLRNIPVGGGSRKNKRSPLSSISLSSKKLPHLVTPPISLSSSQNPNDDNILKGQDLNLAFPSTQDVTSFSQFIQVPGIVNEGNNSSSNKNPSTSDSTTSQLSALELLTGISPRGLNTFLPMPVQDPNSVYTSGFPLQEPALNFSLDGLGCGTFQEASGRLLFPFEDVKQISTTSDIEQNRELGVSTGYWTGMLGGGGGSW